MSKSFLSNFIDLLKYLYFIQNEDEFKATIKKNIMQWLQVNLKKIKIDKNKQRNNFFFHP